MGTDLFEHVGIAVENGDVRTETGGHLRRVETDHAAADHDDLARHHARHAAE